jgi:hypothetical protein
MEFWHMEAPYAKVIGPLVFVHSIWPRNASTLAAHTPAASWSVVAFGTCIGGRPQLH